MEKALPRIVCAAMRCVDIVVVGPRHYDSVMQQQIAFYESLWTKNKVEQGFIDQHGNFYNRHDAWVIAEANGQIYRRCGGDTIDGGRLFSENLY